MDRQARTPERRAAPTSRSRSPDRSLERATRIRSPLQAREQEDDRSSMSDYEDEEEEERGRSRTRPPFRAAPWIVAGQELVIFCDGSIEREQNRQQQRSQAGIAMAAFVDNRWIVRACYVGPLDSSNDAECCAALMAIDFASSLSQQRPWIRSVQIVTDCSYMALRLRENHLTRHSSYNVFYRMFEQSWQMLASQNIIIEISTVRANMGVRGNVLVDEASWELRRFFENTPWKQEYEYTVFRREEPMINQRWEEFYLETSNPCSVHGLTPCGCAIARPPELRYLPQIRAMTIAYGRHRHERDQQEWHHEETRDD